MMPQRLQDWNLQTLRDIVAQGVFEHDEFDFKEALPPKKDSEAKKKLKSTCAAFANSSGGFLIYGVKNDKLLKIDERICGTDAKLDFPEHFGNFPAGCVPSIHWTFKNPPITLDSGKNIHVVYIPRSWKAPHAVESDSGSLLFPKRTNKGTEFMAIEEVRNIFLSFYEKRIRLH